MFIHKLSRYLHCVSHPDHPDLHKFMAESERNKDKDDPTLRSRPFMRFCKGARRAADASLDMLGDKGSPESPLFLLCAHSRNTAFIRLRPSGHVTKAHFDPQDASPDLKVCNIPPSVCLLLTKISTA